MSDRIIDDKNSTFIGLNLPLTNSQYGYFNPTLLTLEQAKVNLKNLILTKRGERVMRPNIGTDLYTLIFEKIDNDNLEDVIRTYIYTAVNTWLPYIKLTNVITKDINSNTDQNQIIINIKFTIDEEIYEELTFSLIKD